MNRATQPEPALSILVLNWNGHSDTSALLGDLRDQLSDVAAGTVEVLVLDNGSSMPVPEWWTDLRGVTVIESERNLGYSGGMARLVDRSRAAILWLLNNDVRLMDGALVRAVAIASRGHAGITFPVIFNPDGSMQSRDCFWNPILGWRTGPQVDGDASDEYEIFGDLFVAPIIARSAVLDLGLFPAEFHTYGEDFDACYAAALAGVQVLRDRRLLLSHRKSSSRPNASSHRFHFECQGARNYLASILVNYSYRNYWAIPLCFAKIMLVDLVLRRQAYPLKSIAALKMWAGVPLASIRLATELSELRRRRAGRRRRSDRAVWAIR